MCFFIWFMSMSPARRRWRRPARRRIPLAAVRFELELSAGVERLVQILRVINDSDDEQPLVAVRMFRQPVEVFRDRCIFAVGYAVLAQIAVAKMCCRDFERAALIDGIRRSRSSAKT